MRSYAEAEVFSISEIQDLYRATRLVMLLPGRVPGGDPKGEYVRCHELARVIAPLLFHPWEVVDGKYGPIEHSWLVNSYGHILDVYAVARLPQVQLIDGLWLGNYKRFRREEARTDINQGVIRLLSWILKPEDINGRDTERPPRPEMEDEGRQAPADQGHDDGAPEELPEDARTEVLRREQRGGS